MDDFIKGDDLLKKLLDPERDDPIYMYDETGRMIEFEQVATIPYREKLYCVLKPVDEIDGVGPDEAMVFRVDKDGEEESQLIYEDNLRTAKAIFRRYYKLVRESKKAQKKK